MARLQTLGNRVTTQGNRLATAAPGSWRITVTAEINIRYRKDVVAGQHLVHDGTTYEIIAPLATNQRDMLKLMCKTVKPK